MSNSKIKWTKDTWNPISGCTKISDGCKYCYAESFASRLQGKGAKGYKNGFKFNTVPSQLSMPLKTKKPTVFLLSSMSDVFHEQMPDSYLDQIFDVIKKTPHHWYQILTKRPERMFQYLSKRVIPDNVLLGVTAENRKDGLPRIDWLRKLKAKVLFLSIEPLLEDLGNINLDNIGWVIVGGESGNRGRPMDKNWVLNIKKQCKKQNIPFFFKQWGTWGEDNVKRNKELNGEKIDGKIYQQFPAIIEGLFPHV